MKKIWIMHDTQHGNGKILAELLAKEFPSDYDVSVGDVKTTPATTVAQETPELLILGGAIRKFQGPKQTIKWLKTLSEELTKLNATIPYGAGTLTHMMPPDATHGYRKRFLKNVAQYPAITSWHGEFLSAQVKGIKGPLLEGEFEKAKQFIKDIMAWAQF
ncbi:MAG: hypothetical protein ACTSWW_09655, partial [Promethearchaeota archaeon]